MAAMALWVGAKAQAPMPGTEPAIASRPAALLEESPKGRILKRNLFHPTRNMGGLVSEAEAVQVPFPILKGIVLVGSVKGAMLQWPSEGEIQFLELGALHAGYLLAKVESDRVELLTEDKKNGRWLGLDDAGNSRTVATGEFEKLLALPQTFKSVDSPPRKVAP
ncbi:hypothetical protein [Geothrix sp. 21YS21S-4]|uniref:hypothetical protein n=1 Tax=Geothrix sp. 21YS21S-4 TaxID=3068889 RepID=UPI0027B9ECF8|nr:hypothetical protein [Geothrix sp. 21YS21S-4]